MGLRAAMRFVPGSRPLATLLALLLASSFAWGFAEDDETVVLDLLANVETGRLSLYQPDDPDKTAVAILPCYPPNRPFLGGVDDPVLIGRSGDFTVFEGRMIDPSRFLVEPPDDRGTVEFFAPTQVRFQLALPWTGEYAVLDIFASPDDQETGKPLLQIVLDEAIAAYPGRNAETDEVCQDPEAIDAQREAIDTEARIGEALKEIGKDDPR